MANYNDNEDCFAVFKNNSPKKNAENVENVENQRLKLIREYSPEIKMIDNMLQNLRNEIQTFYTKALPEIMDTLGKNEAIDEKVKKIWLEKLVENMERSFSLSYAIINEYEIEKFKEHKGSVNTEGEQ